MHEIVIDMERTGLDSLDGQSIVVPIPSGGMVTILFDLVFLSRSVSNRSQELELVALRRQLMVLRRLRAHLLRLLSADRICCFGLCVMACQKASADDVHFASDDLDIGSGFAGCMRPSPHRRVSQAWSHAPYTNLRIRAPSALGAQGARSS
jgi:hypothetical protein